MAVTPKQLANLTANHISTDPVGFQKKSVETKLRRGMIRRATLEALNTGKIKVQYKDVSIIGKDGKKLDIEFDYAEMYVPNYTAIGMKIMKEALSGNNKCIEILIGLDENYENRKIKQKDKEINNQEQILDHIKGITKFNPIEEGEVIEYEELKRSVE
ncbi:MAG: hypothetical protein ABI851_12085 [Saprospiraceae bacterium]